MASFRLFAGDNRSANPIAAAASRTAQPRMTVIRQPCRSCSRVKACA